MPTLSFDNSYHRELEGFYAESDPVPCKQPELLYLNQALLQTCGIEYDATDTTTLANWFSGNQLPEGATPIAQVYAGHQFGQFNPQLGDGRALILGELHDTAGKRIDLCLKGSGRTPFSRGGDGLAALGPMLREVLISEYMYAVGIPTTRSLAVVTTGVPVYRNTVQPGAILTRTAASHVRIGTFEYFAAKQQHDAVKQLADYCIARHFPAIADDDNPYLAFLQEVIKHQAELIAKWMGVGFIHGVMNTDNMTIAGETIDYGPCAFMEAYNPDAVFSSIDHYGRYAYKNQPTMAQWNLARFAESIVPLLDDDQDNAIEIATTEIKAFDSIYRESWIAIMRNKLGLTATSTDNNTDDDLISNWLDLLEKKRIDFTLAFYHLSDAATGNFEPLNQLFSYSGELENWLEQWLPAINPSKDKATGEKVVEQMNGQNPWITPRNHRVEAALEAASEGDLSLFESLTNALEHPFDFNPALEELTQPASNLFTADYQTFCGT